MKNKIKLLLKKIKGFNHEYEINIVARSISYYYLAAITSLIIFLLQFLNTFNILFSNYVFSKLLLIISDTYSDIIEKVLESFSISSFSIILFITFIYNFTKIIYSFILYTNKLYGEGNDFYKAILKTIVFILFIITIIVASVIVSNNIGSVVEKFIKSNYIFNLMSLFIEYIILLFIIALLFYFLIPEKRKLKNMFECSFFSSTMIFISIRLFIQVFEIFFKQNKIIGITFVLSMIAFLIFIINYFILLGIIINYRKDIVVNNINGG